MEKKKKANHKPKQTFRPFGQQNRSTVYLFCLMWVAFFFLFKDIARSYYMISTYQIVLI